MRSGEGFGFSSLDIFETAMAASKVAAAAEVPAVDDIIWQIQSGRSGGDEALETEPAETAKEKPFLGRWRGLGDFLD